MTTPATTPDASVSEPPGPAGRVGAQVRRRPWTASIRRPVFCVVVMALVGVLFANEYPATTIAFVLAMSTWAGVIVWSMVRHRDARIVAAIATLAFLPWFAWRASPWLLIFDLFAFFGLGLHALSRRNSVFRSTLGGYFGQWLDGLGHAFTGIAVFQRAVRSSTASRSGRIGHLAKQAVVPTLIVLVALAVLAAGDELFASYVSISVGDQVLARVFFAVFGVGLFMAAAGVSARPAAAEEESLALDHDWSVPLAPVLLSVAGLAVLLCAYGAVQLSAALLGAEYVRARTGLSYAEWARQGFASIAVVALISTAVLGAAGTVKDPARRRLLQCWATVLAVAVGGIALSSILKLAVYVEQYGLTMLRLYTITFTGWLAVVAVLQLGAIWSSVRSWLATAVLVTALIGVFAMNVVNPERIVVNTNIDRAINGVAVPGEPVCDRTGSSCYNTFDPYYAAGLSADAVGVGFERLDELPAHIRNRFKAELCERNFDLANGFHYNRSIGAARAAQRRYCD